MGTYWVIERVEYLLLLRYLMATFYGPWRHRVLLAEIIGPILFLTMLWDVLYNVCAAVYYHTASTTGVSVVFIIVSIIHYYIFMAVLRDFLFGRLYNGKVVYKWMSSGREWCKFIIYIIVVFVFNTPYHQDDHSCLYLGSFHLLKVSICTLPGHLWTFAIFCGQTLGVGTS